MIGSSVTGSDCVGESGNPRASGIGNQNHTNITTTKNIDAIMTYTTANAARVTAAIITRQPTTSQGSTIVSPGPSISQGLPLSSPTDGASNRGNGVSSNSTAGGGSDASGQILPFGSSQGSDNPTSVGGVDINQPSSSGGYHDSHSPQTVAPNES